MAPCLQIYDEIYNTLAAHSPASFVNNLWGGNFSHPNFPTVLKAVRSESHRWEMGEEEEHPIIR